MQRCPPTHSHRNQSLLRVQLIRCANITCRRSFVQCPLAHTNIPIEGSERRWKKSFFCHPEKVKWVGGRRNLLCVFVGQTHILMKGASSWKENSFFFVCVICKQKIKFTDFWARLCGMKSSRSVYARILELTNVNANKRTMGIKEIRPHTV